MALNLSLRTLECFVAVAEELSFSRAAERLFLAQPALSQQMRTLESRLGTQLLDRGSRPLRLTEAGSYLLDEARRIIALCESAATGVHDIGTGNRGWLNVGFTRSAMYSVLPAALKAFHHAYPHVELEMFEMLTNQQADALRDSHIHVGIGREAPDLPGCVTRVLLRERLMVVLPADHPQAVEEQVRLADLAETPLILFPKHGGAQFSRFVKSLYAEAGLQAVVAHQTYEIQTAIALVAAGLGVTFIGESVARHGRSDVVYRPLTGPGSSRLSTLSARYREDDASPHLKAFLDCLPPEPDAAD